MPYPVVDLRLIKFSIFPVILMLALFICMSVYKFSNKYDKFYFSQIRMSSLYCTIGAGIGGKIVYVLTRCSSPGLDLITRFGGFVFYGGLIGAIVGLYIYSIRVWNRFLDLLDTYASLVPLGQAIGRIGCYFNGCCYGKSYDGFGAVRYIVNGEETYVFPTWFIESSFCFLLFICMFCISKEIFSGCYSVIYLTSYSLFRFEMEFFRGDLLRGVRWGLSTSQYISVFVLLLGVIILKKTYRTKDKNLMIIRRSKNANKCIPR